jgi:tricorn protease
MTSPDNAVFDPIRNEWIGENVGIAPDIEVSIDAKSFSEGRDVQLERGVEEALKLLEKAGVQEVTPPPYPRPAVRSGN